jgi:hypothetical protein
MYLLDEQLAQRLSDAAHPLIFQRVDCIAQYPFKQIPDRDRIEQRGLLRAAQREILPGVGAQFAVALRAKQAAGLSTARAAVGEQQSQDAIGK